MATNPVQLSPGVRVTELDFSLVVREPASTIAGIAGEFRWGPAETPVTIDKEKTLVETFCKPRATDNSAQINDFFCAANFLQYGDNLKVIRAVDATTAKNAVDVSSPPLIKNETVFTSLLGTGDARIVDSTNHFIARYPGPAGNSLKVVAIDDMTGSSTSIGVVAAFQANLLDDDTYQSGTTFGTFNISYQTTDGDVGSAQYRGYFIYGTGGNVQNTIIPAIGSNKTLIETTINNNGVLYEVLDANAGSLAGSDPYDFSATINSNLLKIGTTPPVNAPTFLYHVQGSSDFLYSRMAASGGFISPVSGANPSGITLDGLFFFVATSNNAHLWVTTSNYFDDLKIIVPSVAAVSGSVTDAQVFAKRPGTSQYVSERGGTNDELSIAVIDEDGEFTGIKGYVLEKFELLSKAYDAKNIAGEDNYYKTVINNGSQYIYLCADLPSTGGGFTGNSTSTFGNLIDQTSSTFYQTNQFSRSLTGGTAPNFSTVLDLYGAGYAGFADEDVDVNLIIDHRDDISLSNSIIDLADTRADVIVCTGIKPQSLTQSVPAATDYIVTRKQQLKSSSFAAIVAGQKNFKDNYGNIIRQMNHASDLAGLIAAAAQGGEPWFSPAGYNRGVIRNIIDLTFNPSKTYRDELYKVNLNPVAAFPGAGFLLFGDKTNLLKPSALDRINVRRLFIVLEEALAQAARFQLFEINDEFTRSQFRNLANPFLRGIEARRGISEFRVICDETNNTAQVIDSNQFVADIYIKPTRSINFIQLNFVAVGSSATFTINE